MFCKNSFLIHYSPISNSLSTSVINSPAQLDRCKDKTAFRLGRESKLCAVLAFTIQGSQV